MSHCFCPPPYVFSCAQSGSGVVADVKDVVSSLKALEGKCSQEEFHSLCYCLTLPSLKSEYRRDTVIRGVKARTFAGVELAV